MNRLWPGIIALLALSPVARAQTPFFINNIQATTNGQITLTWPTAPYTAYHVQFANSPTDLWADLPAAPVNAGSNTTSLAYTDSPPAFLTNGFYRIRKPSYQNVILTLVMDRSGSLASPSLSAALTGAITSFINSFNDTVDQAAFVTFATTTRVDVAMTQPFQQQIINAAGSLQYTGASFTQDGLTNALIQDASVVIPPGQSALKVAVFVTDGAGNIIQTTLNCGGTPTVWNIGGHDGGTIINFFNPTNGTVVCTANGGTVSCCSGVTTFQSAIDGTQKGFVQSNVAADATYLTVQTANRGFTLCDQGQGVVRTSKSVGQISGC
jgi:hypothetical protein